MRPTIWHGTTRGGSGGGKFDDIDIVGYYGIYTPKSINVRCGVEVDSIQINYQTKSSSAYQGPRRGGGGGGDCKIDLGPDERIVKVEGRYGNIVDALQFTTSSGRKSPLCGGGGGGYFSESRPGYVLSYISGRCGSSLDSIQFHWVREEIRYIMTSVKYDLNNIRRSVQGTPKYTHSFELINRAPNDQTVSTTYTYATEKSETWTMSSEMTVSVSNGIRWRYSRYFEGFLLQLIVVK